MDFQSDLGSPAARHIRHEAQRARTVLKGEAALRRTAFEFAPGTWYLANAHWLTKTDLRFSVCLPGKEPTSETRHQDRNRSDSQNDSFHEKSPFRYL
jgi:hypothetical protein